MKENIMIYSYGICQIISDDSYKDVIKKPVIEIGKAFLRAVFTSIMYNLTGRTI